MINHIDNTKVRKINTIENLKQILVINFLMEMLGH